MRQVAYPAAVGSCMVGADSTPAPAAEWSVSPVYSSSVDYDSNRRLAPDGNVSDAGVLTVDVRLKRSLENFDLVLEPNVALRRFTDRTFGNGNDYTLRSSLGWADERSQLNLSASYLDQSTLTTEVLETGIISGDTHRRQTLLGATWSRTQTERRTLIAQLSYSDTSYYGQATQFLPGYRYGSGSAGERYGLSERTTFTASVYGSFLTSPVPRSSSHETGIQAEVVHNFSERTNVDVAFGGSRRTLSGAGSNGTTASLSLNHSFTLDRLSLEYTRSLVPYGIGFLVEQQQYSASYTHALNEYMEGSLSFLRIQNNQTAALLRIDRRSYDDIALGANWRPLDTLTVAARADAIHSQAVGLEGKTLNSWRSSLTLTWIPYPKAMSQ